MKHAATIALLGAYIMRPCHWDKQAEEWSRRLPHDWPGRHNGSLGRKVESGEYSCSELVHSVTGRRLAFMVYAVDRHFPQPEFVLKAAYSASGHVDVTGLCLEEIEAKARELGCATCRFTTMRPGLIEKTMRAGWRVSEVVVRKDVRRV